MKEIEKIMRGWEKPPTFEQVEEGLKKIASKAVEAYKKDLLKKLPEEMKGEYTVNEVGDLIGAQGFNDCLKQIKNIIQS